MLARPTNTQSTASAAAGSAPGNSVFYGCPWYCLVRLQPDLLYRLGGGLRLGLPLFRLFERPGRLSGPPPYPGDALAVRLDGLLTKYIVQLLGAMGLMVIFNNLAGGAHYGLFSLASHSAC